LEPAIWKDLARRYSPPDLLEAVKCANRHKSQDPDEVFASLCYWLDRLKEERQQRNATN
jgi:hypothetical protein